jgi:hypothetical protein
MMAAMRDTNPVVQMVDEMDEMSVGMMDDSWESELATYSDACLVC